MKAKDLRNKDVSALTEELHGLLKEQFTLRMQNATGQLAQNHSLKSVRRDIARIKTLIGEKQREGGAA